MKSKRSMGHWGWWSSLLLAGCSAQVGPEGVDQAAATPPRPDLVVAALSGPPSTEGPFEGSVQVCNRGPAPSSPTRVNIYVSRDKRIVGLGQRGGDPLAGSMNIADLAPTQCQTVAGPLFASVSVEGTYYLGAIVDEPSAVPESNERNNTFVGGQIGIGHRPDLVVRAISGPTSTMGELPLSVRVCNQGTTPSGPNQVNAYLSLDTVIRGIVAYPSSADFYLGQVPTPPLQAGECATLGSTFFAWTPTPGGYYLGAIIDEQRTESELIESNNTFVGDQVGVGPGSDLIVSALSGPPSGDGPFQVSARVCNRGTTWSSPTQVQVYLSTDPIITGFFENPSTPDAFFGQNQVQGLSPGACANVSVDGYPGVPQPGAYYLGAIVDESGSEPELIETNNHFTGALIGIGAGPDLVVTGITAPPSTTGSFEATIRVCNQGTQPSGGSDVGLYLSSDTEIDLSFNPWGDPPAGNAPFGPLQPGECSNATQSFFAPVPGDGAYYLAAVVDPWSNQEELIESNNIFVGDLIGVGNGPDLVIRSLEGPASSNGPISLRAEACNQGTQPSGSGEVAIYLSSDAVIDGVNQTFPGDPFAGFLQFPNLSPGECRLVAGELYAPVPGDGAYYLLAQIDPWDGVPELIESNNEFIGGLIGIGNGPDLVVTAIAAPPSTNGPFAPSVTVCNQGTQASAPSLLSVYLSADATLESSLLDPSAGDALAGTLSVPNLEAGQCTVVSEQVYAYVFGGDGAYYLGAIIDEQTNQAELIESNNSFVGGLIGFGNGSDLIVTQIDAPASSDFGSFTASVRVCNQGTAPANDNQLNLYLSRDLEIRGIQSPPPQDAFAGGYSTPHLEAGQCQTISVELYANVYDGDGAYYLAAVLDEYDAEPELIESNNTLVGPLMGIGSGPDLVATEIIAPGSSNGSFSATVRLCNQGTAPSYAADVALYLSSDTRIETDPAFGNADSLSGFLHFGMLAPNQCQSVSGDFYAAVPSDGAYYLAAVVDPFEATPELVESNNLFLGGLIGVGNGADLIITDLSGPSSTFGELPVSARVCNQGTQPSGGVDLAIHVSSDAVLEGLATGFLGDPFAGFLQVPPLPAGACAQVSGPLSVAVDSPGAYYLLAALDPWNTQAELIESNNGYNGGLIGVGAGSDLVVEAFAAPASTLGSFDGTVTVCNRGTQPSAPSTASVYVSEDQQIEGTFANPALGDNLAGTIAVPALEAGACASITEPLYAFVFGPPGSYYLGVIVDEWQSEPELIESNNVFVGSQIGVGPGSDLVVRSIEAPASANGSFTATARLCNQGTTYAGPTQLNFYLSADQVVTGSFDPIFQDPFAGSLSAPGLEAGQCANVTGELYAYTYEGDGAYYLAAIADEWQSEPELNEGNNTFVGSLIGVGNGPDLVATQIAAPASSNGGFSATVRVCNQGTAPSSNGDAAIFLSTDQVIDAQPSPDGDLFAGLVHYGPLSPGQCQDVSEMLYAPVPTDGAYYLAAVVDFSGGTPELIETNNTFVGGLIGLGNGPDLVVGALTTPASTTGELATTAQVCNQGTQPAPAGDLAIFLSSDAVLQGLDQGPQGDLFAGFLNYPPLQAGQCQMVSQTLWAPVPPMGAYYVLGQVDPWNNTPELIESNNFYQGQLIGVGFGSDLVVSDLEAPASTFGPFDATVTVCNQGTQSSGPSQTSVYVSADPVIESGYFNPGQGDNLAGIVSIPGLPAGQCAAVTGSFYAAVFGPSGTFYLGAIADEGNSEPELIESNNVFLGPELGIGPGSDLVITQLSGPPSSNGPFDAALTVCNQGTTPAAPNQVSVYLSSDDTLVGFSDNQPGAEDFFAGMIAVDALLPGECTSLSAPLWAGAPLGNYRLGGIVDEWQSEPELNEGNNRGLFGTLVLTP